MQEATTDFLHLNLNRLFL